MDNLKWVPALRAWVPRTRFERIAHWTTRTTAGIASLILAVAVLTAAITQIDLTTQVKGILPVANGGTGTSNAAQGTAGGVVLSNSPTITTPSLTSPSFTGSFGSNFDIGTNAELAEAVNDTTTGTTVNLLAKLSGAPSRAIKAATTDTKGVLGIVIAGAGTAGNAQIAVSGNASCVFDGATTAGNYVKISATTAGDCADGGSAFPTSGQILGRVLSTNGSGGTYGVFLFGPEIQGISGSTLNFADSEVPSGTIDGSNATFTLAHTVSPALSLALYKNGQEMIAGASADYTLSGLTITYASGSKPKTGDVHVAFYRW